MTEEKYVELYKKYRPEKWEELIGQEKTAKSLQLAVINNKLPTTYGFFGPRGCGKDLHKDTIIPTPTGMTTMGELKIGDKVLGSNGKATTVTNKYCPMDSEIYEITFSDKTKVKAGAGHLWETETHAMRENESTLRNIVTSAQISETLLFKGLFNHSVKVVSSPVEYVENNASIDDPDFTLENNKIDEKYLFSNVNTREEVLSAVLDRNGWLREETVHFMPNEFNLHKDTKLIAHSLGYQTIDRKASNGAIELYIYSKDEYSSRRQIVSAEKITDNPADYFCISVEAEDELFLCTESFIPTHNTSSALLLAKALNCEDQTKEGNPCNICDTCINIDNKTQIGINYESMANNGSVNDVKDMVRRAQLSQPVKKQIWILDEVHNLSRAAFDSLLIPLESTKMQSLFILCSTEVDKIPMTIASRIQQRRFSLVSSEQMFEFLQTIKQKENLACSDEDLNEAIRQGRGSVRDTLGALESFVTTGESATSFGGSLLEAIAAQDLATAFKVIADATNDGYDGKDLAEQLFSDLRDILMLVAGVDKSLAKSIPVSDIRAVAKGLIGRVGITAVAEEVAESINHMTLGSDSKIQLEIALLKAVTKLKKLQKAVDARSQ